jgi:uncharacterized protein YjbI with pentapeptide repeats
MNENNFFEAHFKQVDYGAENLRNAVFESCVFENCSFAQLNFIELTFEDCEFIDCDFTGAFINETAFREVSFVGCKMIGLNFESVNPFRLKIQFEDSMLDYASFHNLKLLGLKMINCSLKECDFTAAQLKKAVFTNSILTGAQFNNTNLIDADFRLSNYYSINPSLNQVKGARFSTDGLMGLLEAFKIRVDD